MSREIIVGQTIYDQFPAWELNGFDKKSGLAGSFIVSIWRDGALQAVPVTITEIGSSGEYRTAFQPNAPGFWFLEVKIPYNRDVWKGEYASVGDLKFGCSMGEDGAIFAANIWLNLDGQRLIDVDTMSAKIKDGGGFEIADLGTSSTPSSDGVFEFSCGSGVLDRHVPYLIEATATRDGATFHANLGFTRV